MSVFPVVSVLVSSATPVDRGTGHVSGLDGLTDCGEVS